MNQIAYEPAAVEAQYQNPVERHIQQLDKCVSTNLAAAEDLEPNFWGLCVLGYAVVANYTPNELSGKYSPWYEVTGKHPDLSETCKFPFGQGVTVAKTKHELKSRFRFTTRNEFGVAVGSTTHGNGSTLVYLPSRNKVYMRINVIELKPPQHEWTSENGEPLPPEDPLSPLVMINEDEPVPLNEILANINSQPDDPPLLELPNPDQTVNLENPDASTSTQEPVADIDEFDSDHDDDLPEQKKKAKAEMNKRRKKSKKDEVLYTVRIRIPILSILMEYGLSNMRMSGAFVP